MEEEVGLLADDIIAEIENEENEEMELKDDNEIVERGETKGARRRKNNQGKKNKKVKKNKKSKSTKKSKSKKKGKNKSRQVVHPDGDYDNDEDDNDEGDNDEDYNDEDYNDEDSYYTDDEEEDLSRNRKTSVVEELGEVAGSIFSALESVSQAAGNLLSGANDAGEDDEDDEDDEDEEWNPDNSSDEDAEEDGGYSTDDTSSTTSSADDESQRGKQRNNSRGGASSGSDSEGSLDGITTTTDLQGITLNNTYYTQTASDAQVWLIRGILACRLGLYDRACNALDRCNRRSFSLHGWMAKLQVLVMRTEHGDDMRETDASGKFIGMNRTFKLMEETLEALCRVMLFVQEFNQQYEAVSTEMIGVKHSGAHNDQSDSYLRKTFYILVAQYGLIMIKRGVEKMRHRSRKGIEHYLDGKKLQLPDLIQMLTETAERLRVQGSDR
tara:strand:- start:86 stop:1405 length:1320 start_codon:yes stop_codon:yes gene_type:complete